MNANTEMQFESLQKELVEEFSKHRESLWFVIYNRLDHRLCGRIDPDDVLQEAFVDAINRLPQFVAQRRSWSLLVWIRVILKQTLINVHRRHFSAQKRDASKEITRDDRDDSRKPRPLVETCVGRSSSPSQVAIRRESVSALETALDKMKATDRQILMLRHFEELTNKESASRLEISEKAASVRYIRAIERLKKVIGGSCTSATDAE
jgi:RNA polymerase sigma-70 factor (ECF subfamily)